MKHTRWIIDKAEDLPLAIIEDTENGDGVAEIGKRTKRNIANANLIASAPELYEACKDITQAYSDNISIMPVFLQTYIDKIAQTIAKAEGRV